MYERAYVCNNPKCVCMIPPQFEWDPDLIESTRTKEERDLEWAELEKKLVEHKKMRGLKYL